MIASLRCFFDLLVLLCFVVHFVVLVLPVLVVIDLPSICLILATSRMLLVLVISVDTLHHNVPTLWIHPVVIVDVPLESAAENPPEHKTTKVILSPLLN